MAEPAAPPRGCPPAEVLAQYVDGEVHQPLLASLDAHIAGCSDCHYVTIQLSALRPAFNATELGVQGPGRVDPADPPEEIAEFRIVRPLGSGAMGRVYLARDTVLGRAVAIKFLFSQSDLPDDELRDRFLDEARAIARITHPSVVAIYRVGELGGQPYLVSEYVKGQSLDQLRATMPWQRALAIGRDVAGGLAAAHQGGVLHRDIKPANIMLTDRGLAKLLDFGLAKLRGGLIDPSLPGPGSPLGLSQLSRTHQHAVLGTPRYLAPEGFGGASAVDERSDIYSLALVLYELCTGTLPHEAKSFASLVLQRSNAAPRPLLETAEARRVRPHIERDFAALIDRCLARDPARRPASAQELVAALEALALRAPPRRWPLPLGVAAGVSIALGVALGPGLWRVRPGALVELPGGEFSLGSSEVEVEAALSACRSSARDPADDCPAAIFKRELPLHRVRVRPFAIQATEVTLGQLATWLSGLAARGALEVAPEDQPPYAPRWVRQEGALLVDLFPSYTPQFGLLWDGRRFSVRGGHARRPATHVTWIAAARYCRDQGLMLPSEAQWEFAARGASGRRFPWGDLEPRCSDVVFGRKPGGQCGALGFDLAEVGTAKMDRTPEGVYDLGGNVAEWVADRLVGGYPPCAAPCEDPLVGFVDADIHGAGAADAPRVYRGGTLGLDAVVTRASGRSRERAGVPSKDVGFRCVRPTR